jgi:methylated-DNA-[protein]-cysteine S-methyltransferase
MGLVWQTIARDHVIGAIQVVTDGDVLVALEFGDVGHRLMPMLRKRFGSSLDLVAGETPSHVVEAIHAYLDGRVEAVDTVAVDGAGTAFQRLCWNALRAIPPGETRTYGEMAKSIGHPHAARAVGLANAMNPISLIVPCHRLVGSSGNLTGYGGGIERKRWLLEHERRWASGRDEVHSHSIVPGGLLVTS